MTDIIFWIDAQITEAKRSSDKFLSEGNMNQYYYELGRYNSLWAVKNRLEKNTP